jgi:hypothetical protein
VRPEGPTDSSDNAYAAAWLDAVEKYLQCEARHDALVHFLKGKVKE